MVEFLMAVAVRFTRWLLPWIHEEELMWERVQDHVRAVEAGKERA